MENPIFLGQGFAVRRLDKPPGAWRVGPRDAHDVVEPYTALRIGELAEYAHNRPGAQRKAVQELDALWASGNPFLPRLIIQLDRVLAQFYGDKPPEGVAEQVAWFGKQAALCRAWLEFLEGKSGYQAEQTALAAPLWLWRRYGWALALLGDLRGQPLGEQERAVLDSWDDLDDEYRRVLHTWGAVLIRPESEWLVESLAEQAGAQSVARWWEEEVARLLWQAPGQLHAFFQHPGQRRTTQRFLDRIARQWLLPRYDLVGVSRLNLALLQVQPQKRGYARAVVRVLRGFYTSSVGLPWLAVVGGALGVLGGVGVGAAGHAELGRLWLGLAGVWLGVLLVLSWLGATVGGLGRMAFYPFSLRLLGGTVVGLIGLAGLNSQFAHFTFHALDGARWVDRLPALLVLLVSLASAALYLLADALSRLGDLRLAARRTGQLLLYGWAQATVAATVACWLGAGRLLETGCKLAERTGQLLETGCKLHRAVEVGAGLLSLDYIVSASVLALGVGVFTQSLWETKTVTEPL